MTLDYLRDPTEIYRQSFDTIRRESDLSRLSKDEAVIATRIIHACGMTDIVNDLVFAGDVAGAAREALAARRPIFTDVDAVRAAVLHKRLPEGVDARCMLHDAHTSAFATEQKTTRSAAGVLLRREHLAGAIVLIGNAPTALFALLDMLDHGAAPPAALFAFPVGFVGAVESKAELVDNPRGLNFVTLAGRRGGSASAAAAFNAVLVGATDQ